MCTSRVCFPFPGYYVFLVWSLEKRSNRVILHFIVRVSQFGVFHVIKSADQCKISNLKCSNPINYFDWLGSIDYPSTPVHTIV